MRLARLCPRLAAAAGVTLSVRSSPVRRLAALTVSPTLRNGLWNAGANALIALVGVLSSVIVVRSLSPEAYGVFSYHLWLASVCTALGMLALPQALTKVSAELLGQNRHQDADALTAVVWRAALVLNGLVALIITAVWLQHPQNLYLLIVAAAQLPVALTGIASSHLWGRQTYRPVAVWTSLATLVQLALLALAQFLGWAGPGFAAAILGSTAVTWIGLTARLSPVLSWRAPMPPRRIMAQYASFLLPATLSRLVEVVVWQRSELLFLSRLSTEAQIGFYSLAYTIYAIVLGVGWALINGYYPSISYHQGAGQDRAIRHKLHQGLTLAVLYAAPVGFGMAVTLGALIRFLYGDKMLPSVAVGQILLLGLTPGVLCGMLALTVAAVGRVWLDVTLGLAAAAVNIALALWLVPEHGALGAALATTGAQVAYFFGLAWATSRVCGLRVIWRQPARLLVLAAVTTLTLPLLLQRLLPGPEILKVVLAALLGGLCYLLVVWYGGYLQQLRSSEETL